MLIAQLANLGLSLAFQPVVPSSFISEAIFSAVVPHQGSREDLSAYYSPDVQAVPNRVPGSVAGEVRPACDNAAERAEADDECARYGTHLVQARIVDGPREPDHAAGEDAHGTQEDGRVPGLCGRDRRAEQNSKANHSERLDRDNRVATTVILCSKVGKDQRYHPSAEIDGHRLDILLQRGEGRI